MKNVIFIWVPKCAGTSIWRSLNMTKLKNPKEIKKPQGWVTFGHTSLEILLKEGYISKEFFESSFKFAFVRNPFDRLVSLFFYHKDKKGTINTNSFEEFCHKYLNDTIIPIGLYNSKELSQLNPQTDWLYKPDFIGRVETINQDFNRLCKILDIKPSSLHKRNITKHKEYEHYYTKELKNKVYDFYKKDFEILNYD